MTGELHTDGGSTVGQLGEDAVLSLIRERIDAHNAALAASEPQADRMPVGPGDDAAVVTFEGHDGSAPVVMTTDTISDDQDFRLGWWNRVEAAGRSAAGAAIGIKAAAQNLSDLNAMGASPTALLISLMLPSELPASWVQDFYRGVEEACRRPGAEGCLIAGGDLSSARRVTVTITALGELAAGRAPLRRSGARAGDVVAVCGGLGEAAAGLALLEHHGGVTGAPEFEELLSAQLRPDPPLRAGRDAAEAGATAAMDISDGLLRDARRLARASGVTIRLDDDVLRTEAQRLGQAARSVSDDPHDAGSSSSPAQAGTRPADGALRWVLGGGEEYALLATFPSSAQLPEGFRVIGTAAETGAHRSGTVQTGLGAPAGWDSLSR